MIFSQKHKSCSIFICSLIFCHDVCRCWGGGPAPGWPGGGIITLWMTPSSPTPATKWPTSSSSPRSPGRISTPSSRAKRQITTCRFQFPHLSSWTSHVTPSSVYLSERSQIITSSSKYRLAFFEHRSQLCQLYLYVHLKHGENVLNTPLLCQKKLILAFIFYLFSLYADVFLTRD